MDGFNSRLYMAEERINWLKVEMKSLKWWENIIANLGDVTLDHAVMIKSKRILL